MCCEDTYYAPFGYFLLQQKMGYENLYHFLYSSLLQNCTVFHLHILSASILPALLYCDCRTQPSDSHNYSCSYMVHLWHALFKVQVLAQGKSMARAIPVSMHLQQELWVGFVGAVLWNDAYTGSLAQGEYWFSVEEIWSMIPSLCILPLY